MPIIIINDEIESATVHFKNGHDMFFEIGKTSFYFEQEKNPIVRKICLNKEKNILYVYVENESLPYEFYNVEFVLKRKEIKTKMKA